MSFLSKIFRPKREPRDSTDAELNAIIEPFSIVISDFKAQTNFSWLIILPAIQKIGTHILVKERGLSSVRLLYETMVLKLDAMGALPPSAIAHDNIPEFNSEDMIELNALLWNFANINIERGVPLEHIGQAYGGFIALASERITGDAMLHIILIKKTYDQILSGEFNASRMDSLV
ncbi:MAG: hypothetical protein LAT81_12945 [Oceanicaulis sp.]|nr:hypothetical protein [Oceanicaulis sp.]